MLHTVAHACQAPCPDDRSAAFWTHLLEVGTGREKATYVYIPVSLRSMHPVSEATCETLKECLKE